MSKRAFPLADVYGLLEPGPVVLVSTHHRGRDNVMALSWHTMMEFEPPLVGLVLSRANHSHGMLRASRECVINIPATGLLDAVVGCGNTSGRDTDKFTAFGLTRRPALRVAAPRIAECWANLECRVVDTRMVRSYDFFVVEVVAACLDRAAKDTRTLHHRGWGRFMHAGPTRSSRSRMR